MTTRVITSPDDKQVLTAVATRDATTALCLGLKEYLETLTTTGFDNKPLKFKKVLDHWATPDEHGDYPSALIFPAGKGNYEATGLGLNIAAADAMSSAPDNIDFALKMAELAVPLRLEVWTTDPLQRVAFGMLLEDKLVPNDWMYGLRLELGHYYGLHASYEMKSLEYVDDATDTQRLYRKVYITLDSNVPMVRHVKAPPITAQQQVIVQAGVLTGAGTIRAGR